MKRICLFVTVVFFGMATSAKVGDVDWKVRMQSMLTDVLRLFPYAYDESKEVPKSEVQNVTSSLESLAKNSLELKKHTSHFTEGRGQKIDPSFSFIADSFENDISMAKDSFAKNRNFNYQARNYLKSSIAKCMMCHTQSNIGPEVKLDQFKNQFELLKPMDRFNAMAATRQFDSAISEFNKIIKDPTTKKNDRPVMDRAARTALAIVVRVKNDPQAALQLVELMQKSESFSGVMSSDLGEWKKSLQKWLQEKPLTLKDEKDYLREAQRLSQNMTTDQSEEKSQVDLLRASSLLRDLLTKFPASSLRAEAYILLSTAYDALPGFAIWDLANEYLGACIVENPHSEMGKKCFNKYEELITLGYTGSSGVNVPSAVKAHLKRMQILAEPEKK